MYEYILTFNLLNFFNPPSIFGTVHYHFLLADQNLILISLTMIHVIDSFKNEMWIFPFKKFIRLWVKFTEVQVHLYVAIISFAKKKKSTKNNVMFINQYACIFLWIKSFFILTVSMKKSCYC